MRDDSSEFWLAKHRGRRIGAVEITDAMVDRAIIAASRGVEGCDTGNGTCGGAHTDCYYRGILDAALNGP